jgi:hypothetical protein
MTSAHACCTIFFGASREELIAHYEEQEDGANGYLTRLADCWIFVDAEATETGNWGRQTNLAQSMSRDDVVALSLFLVGQHWGLALANDGQAGPVAVAIPDDDDVMELLPHYLMAVERVLVAWFPEQADQSYLDELFGALLEGATPVEEVFSQILAMLGCPSDWMRWSWFETIPQQLFTDPDLVSRVTPLGEAAALWEE